MPVLNICYLVDFSPIQPYAFTYRTTIGLFSVVELVVAVGTSVFAYIIGTLIIAVAPLNKSRLVGIITLIIGVLFSWFLVIPANMAIRYKPKYLDNQIIK
jgi:hypothetical protein